MNFKRIVKRTLFYGSKFIMSILAYTNHRAYMKFYNKLLRKNGMKLNGVPRFIAKSVKFDDFDLIELGDRVIISMNVYFLTHDYSYTTAAYAAGFPPKTDTETIKGIKVGSNVFIGMNSIIMPGTVIGNDIIIGAGSVVRGEIPDYSIVIGNPAKVVGDSRKLYKKLNESPNLILKSDTI